MSNQKQCYLCGHNEFRERPGSVRDNDELKIYECLSCGLVFLSSFENTDRQSYENSGMHVDPIYERPLEIKEWLNETERDDERRFQYLKSLLHNRRLLDFGCGVGGFLLKARGSAAEVHGVELEKRLSNHFRRNNLTVFNNISEIKENNSERAYDIITLFHVLEHLPDPKSVLIDLSGFLTEGGQVIVEVPNVDDALLSLYKSEPFSHFTYWSPHLYYFSNETLKKLVSQTALKISYIKQIQRYPLSNHLYWLAFGKPGGNKKWDFLDDEDINSAYESKLAAIGKCDTLIASFSLKTEGWHKS